MRRLSDETNETVILVRLIGGSAVCVHRIEAQHYLRISFEPGQPVPLEGGASARLLLASLTPAERRRALAGRLRERDPERAAWIEQEVELAGERGWAVSQEEIHRGVWAVSAAIRDHGRTIATLTVPSPLVRAPAELHDELIARVRAAAAEITDGVRARREAACPYPGRAAGGDEPRLVGEHDRLDAVAQPELVQDVRHVGLDGRVADDQRGGDLGVRSRAPAAAAPPARAASARRARCGRVRWAGPMRANSSISRRVTVGASSASPPATARIPSASWAGACP